jgi:hypothetical protein
MNKKPTLEQNRQKSIDVWAQAKRDALNEAVKNTPVNPATAAGLGTGSGSMFENEYVDNDYLSLDYLYN